MRVVKTSAGLADMAAKAGEVALDFGSECRPMGYSVYPKEPYVIMAMHRGVMGFVSDMGLLTIFMRMLAREALAGRLPLDFRAYRWEEEKRVWVVCLEEVEVEG